jgi:hypothetical protein
MAEATERVRNGRKWQEKTGRGKVQEYGNNWKFKKSTQKDRKTETKQETKG